METRGTDSFNVRKYRIKSPADGLEISILSCSPSSGAKGIVQLVHGMCEHKERYLPFMEFLASEGYASIIHDHRGHGESVKSSDDLGYFYEGGYAALVEDIGAVNRLVRGDYPGLRLALLGHSMGSMAVRSYVRRYDDTADALIVCGSPSYNPAAGIAKVLAKVYVMLAGKKHRPELIQNLAFGSFNRKFGKVSSPHAWVCSDPEIVDRYDRDPLCNFQFTNDGFMNLFSLMQDAYDTENWALHNPQMPVLFISGADDPCLGPKAGFRKAVHAMQKAGYRNVGSILYPDMRHEILNEPDRMKVWDDILDFAGKSLP